ISQNPVLSLPRKTQDVEQHNHDRQIANCERHFQRKCRLVNRSYGAEEQLRSRRIWARYLRMIQRTGLRRVQAGEGRIARNEERMVIAEPLDAAVPNISMNVIV